MAQMNASAWCQYETTSQPPIKIVPGSDDGFNLPDDGLDFPPTAYPFRELVTGSIFVLALVFLVWAGWKLLSLI
jgi:hypothetical protein